MNKRLRKKRGIYTKFKDKETWALDYTIANFITPRLKRFKKLNNGYPPSLLFDSDGNYHDDEEHRDQASKEWDTILDEMIWTFEELSKDTLGLEKLDNETIDQYQIRYKLWDDRIKDGLEYFAKYFRDLWW